METRSGRYVTIGVGLFWSRYVWQVGRLFHGLGCEYSSWERCPGFYLDESSRIDELVDEVTCSILCMYIDPLITLSSKYRYLPSHRIRPLLRTDSISWPSSIDDTSIQYLTPNPASWLRSNTTPSFIPRLKRTFAVSGCVSNLDTSVATDY